MEGQLPKTLDEEAEESEDPPVIPLPYSSMPAGCGISLMPWGESIVISMAPRESWPAPARWVPAMIGLGSLLLFTALFFALFVNSLVAVVLLPTGVACFLLVQLGWPDPWPPARERVVIEVTPERVRFLSSVPADRIALTEVDQIAEVLNRAEALERREKALTFQRQEGTRLEVRSAAALGLLPSRAGNLYILPDGKSRVLLLFGYELAELEALARSVHVALDRVRAAPPTQNEIAV